MERLAQGVALITGSPCTQPCIAWRTIMHMSFPMHPTQAYCSARMLDVQEGEQPQGTQLAKLLQPYFTGLDTAAGASPQAGAQAAQSPQAAAGPAGPGWKSAWAWELSAGPSASSSRGSSANPDAKGGLSADPRTTTASQGPASEQQVSTASTSAPPVTKDQQAAEQARFQRLQSLLLNPAGQSSSRSTTGQASISPTTGTSPATAAQQAAPMLPSLKRALRVRPHFLDSCSIT